MSGCSLSSSGRSLPLTASMTNFQSIDPPLIAYNLANMAKEQRVIKIHGKVQGVGYRFFATRVARRLGLKGSIENIRDGYVEAIVEGEKGIIDEWIEELKEGPRYAEVTSIDQETKDYT